MGEIMLLQNVTSQNPINVLNRPWVEVTISIPFGTENDHQSSLLPHAVSPISYEFPIGPFATDSPSYLVSRSVWCV